MKTTLSAFQFFSASAFALTCFLLSALPTRAVTFTNNASLKAVANTNLTSANGVFTVSCWFKMDVPSSLALSQNMIILMDREDGVETSNHAFQLRINYLTGALEFTSKGTSGATTNKLMDGLFVGRWYHVAITRDGVGQIIGYVDGRESFRTTPNLGIITGSGLTVGGLNGTTRLFYGDVIEVAIYNNTKLDPSVMRTLMYADQRNLTDSITAYYKLGFSTNAAEQLQNFASTTAPALTKAGTGGVLFEEVDRAGEQSLFDSRINGGNNAIAPLSGSFVWQDSALVRPVPGIALDFQFGFSSVIPPAPTDGSPDPYGLRTLSDGWRHTFEARAISIQQDEFNGVVQEELKIMSWDGAIETWYRTNTESAFQTRHGEYRGEIVTLPNYQVKWITPEKLVYTFRPPGSSGTLGRLIEVADSHNNRMQLQWDATLLRLTNVIDTVRGTYQFKYSNASSLLTNVSFGQWQANFTYDASNRLASQSFTNTSGLYSNISTTTRFLYTNVMGFTLLDRIVDPRGFTNTAVTYDKYRRKIRVADALNRATTYEYGVPDSRTIRTTDPGPENYRHLTTFDRKGRVTKETDPLLNVTSYTYNPTNGTRLSITEPLGYTTWFSYDSRGNLTARTNVLGEVTRWTFHTNFNRVTSEINAAGWTTFFKLDDTTGSLLSQYDALGLIVTNVYETNGLLLASTDGRGFTSSFTYDTNGFLISKTDAGGATTTYTYNELGWKLTEMNALGQSAAYAYNLNGNVVRTVDPLQRVFTSVYDANGNLLAQTDAKGALTTYSYDAANQKTNMVDRTGTNIWRYAYNARGLLQTTTDPLGNSVNNAYDAAGRLITVSAPLGNVINNHYDPHGNLTNMVDQLGKSWRKTYDQLNRVVAETDPQGDTTFTEYDVMGRVKRTTSPNGWSSVNTYDERGRLRRWLDPEGNKWDYDYDAGLNITNITDALGGKYIMTYGPRNERLSELNQDSKEWQYTYDLLGRLQQQTDPNGTTRALDYDDGGRILSVTFNTGRVNTFAYDDNNNPEMITRSSPNLPASVTILGYDVMDRVTSCRDSFNKTVRFAYDALGRRSTLTYPDGKTLTYKYDVLSRLTNQVDWAGRQLTYAYDNASRLVRRTYPNGVVQTNVFDVSGQLSALTYSVTNASPPTNAINIALNYAYDRNGNKTGTSEKGTLNWPQPTLTDEKADYTASGRLIDREVFNPASTNPQPATINYAYDSSGNLTNATGNGQTWGLTYDEDNRTTRINWDCGIAQKTIINRYDALGRRIAKTVDTTETRYVLDLAGGMERILCDTAPNGQITAYYIHGPDLSYKVDATNAVTCFHADAQANIIALTGAGGTNLAQYAYTPYGRSLGSTNFSVSAFQPFSFVGSQGVMEDLPGLYFMRARYYSAECGVFLSTDPVKPIGPGWKPVAYAYCNGNPLSSTDPKGEWALVDDLTAIGVGAAYGVLNQGISDLIAGEYSGWESYVGSAAGGAVKAELILHGVGIVPGVSGTIGGAVDSAVTQGLRNLTGKQDGWDWNKFGEDVAVGTLSEFVNAGFFKGFYNINVFDLGGWMSGGFRRVTGSLKNHSSSGSASHAGSSLNSSSANAYANNVNQQNISNGTGGTSKGPAVINPLKLEYYAKADAYRAKAKRYSATAKQYKAAYSAHLASHKELMAAFANSDYFSYWLQASQAKQMADQAYQQYRKYDRMADRAREQARKYDRMGDAQK